MSTPTVTRRGAVATYVLVALVTLLIGAAAMQSFTGPGESLEIPRDRVTTHGEWVFIQRGPDSIRAYVAYPERKTKAPAVIVIHEIFGLTDWEPKVADRLAKEGYVAILPDLLSSKYGITPADPDSGRKLVGQLEPERVTADLNAVYAYVNGLPAVAKARSGPSGSAGAGDRASDMPPTIRSSARRWSPTVQPLIPPT